ncbi:MAG: SprT family zinc-dependent metalloprotease [Phaeospirillum sp.]|nr:SprT family zinc-dependent metalloprotease [Phaeospirillum sp.]
MKLTYKVVFSRRKTLTITVERDRSIVVKAPDGTSPEKIREVVESRKLWLYEKTRHPQKYDSLPHPPGKEMVAGESLPYLGRLYRIELTDKGSEITFAQKFLVPRKLAKEPPVFRQWFIERAEEKILPRITRHARNLGVQVGTAKIGDSKYRWGSCTPSDNVIFNWRLIKAPMFVIDYVIVHELAHLMEPNHTPRFWNIVRAQVADFERAKAWLRQNGAVLDAGL